MTLEGFQFSQGSLQDYVDCARRFQLRYVDAQVWPAVQVEPLLEHELRLEMGARFHRLVERHQLGLDESVLGKMIGQDEVELRSWWDAYLQFEQLHTLTGRRYPELSLSAELGGVRFVATVDLLVSTTEGRVVVFDWKTYAYRPSDEWFLGRLQTKVYRLVAVEAGAAVVGRLLDAANVSMVYWVAGAPLEPVVLEYSLAQYEADRRYLAGLVQEVVSCEQGGVWGLTDDERRCRFCEYRSLCARSAGYADKKEMDIIDANSAGGSLVLGLGYLDEVGF